MSRGLVEHAAVAAVAGGVAPPGHGAGGAEPGRAQAAADDSTAMMLRHLKPGPELEEITREVAEYERFRALVGQVTEVNEEICETRSVIPAPGRRRRLSRGYAA